MFDLIFLNRLLDRNILYLNKFVVVFITRTSSLKQKYILHRHFHLFPAVQDTSGSYSDLDYILGLNIYRQWALPDDF